MKTPCSLYLLLLILPMGIVFGQQSTKSDLLVETLKLTTRHEGCDVWVNFEASSDNDQLYYVLEWSTDGEEFERLKKTKSPGRNITKAFSYRHRFAAKMNFYRLKIEDQAHHSIRYSSVVSTSIDCPAIEGALHLFPNPIEITEEKLYVRVYRRAGDVSLSIRSKQDGNKTFYNLPTDEGWNILRLDVSAFTAGTYFLRDEYQNKGKVYRFTMK